MRRARPSPERSNQRSQKASRLSIPQSRTGREREAQKPKPKSRSPKPEARSPKPEAPPCYIASRMGLLFLFVSRWGLILQAVAIIHFIRRRPDWYWLLIILIGGWIGALAYILIEIIPDASLLSTSFQVFPRRRRIRELERAILDNPSAGNYEELGLLYLDDGDFSRARAAYDKAIAPAPTHPMPSTAAASPKSPSEISPPQFPTSN